MCPTCGRGPAAASGYVPEIPGYPWKLMDIAADGYTICSIPTPATATTIPGPNPFAPPEPSHDGHGDDGALLAGS
jgi:hypothetical protein